MNAKFVLFAMITLIFTSVMGHAQAIIDKGTFRKRLDVALHLVHSFGDENKLPWVLDKQELLVQRIVDVIVPLDGRVRNTNSVVIDLFDLGNWNGTVKKLVSHSDAIKKFLDDSQLSEDSKTATIESFRKQARRELLSEVHKFNLQFMEDEAELESDMESSAKLTDKTKNTGNEIVAALKNSTTH